MQEIAPGLWRWTGPHPAWRPGAEPDSPDDWDELVGCVLYECGDAVVFIDPLIPPDAASFWRWADSRGKGRPRRPAIVLEPLLELPIERVVVSHGEAVLQDGQPALRRCLSSSAG